jgi:hypothetical protein
MPYSATGTDHRAIGHRPEWHNHSGITSALPDPSRVAGDAAKVTPARDGHGCGADDGVQAGVPQAPPHNEGKTP